MDPSDIEASGALAQLGERYLCKVDVEGSIPSRSTMGKPGFEASDILVWGGLLVFVTVLVGLAAMKLAKAWTAPKLPDEPPKMVQWIILVGVLSLFWLLTFYRCFLWWRYG